MSHQKTLNKNNYQKCPRIQRLLFRYSESVFIPTPSFGRKCQ